MPWRRASTSSGFRMMCYIKLVSMTVTGLLRISQERFLTHISPRRATGAVVLTMSHRYQPSGHEDSLIKITDDVTKQAVVVAEPGAFLVDVFLFPKF